MNVNVKNAKKLLAPAVLLGVMGLAGMAHAQNPQYRAPYDRTYGGGGRAFGGARPDFPGSQGFAGGQGGVRWEGDVDDTTVVYVHRRDVRTENVSGHSATHVNAREFGRLPDRPATVFLRHEEGRGRVRIVQQPSPANDWTAAVRLRDPQPGRGHYEFELGWQGDGGGQGYDGGGQGYDGGLRGGDGRVFQGARGY